MNRVLVAGASGYAGALAAELIRKHPSLELARRHRAHRRGHDASTSSIRSTASTWFSRSPPRRTVRTSTPRSSPIRTARPRPVVAALREQGMKVVDLSADFRLHDLDTYGALVRRARRAAAARRGRLWPHRAPPRGDRRRRPRRQPGLLPDREHPGAGAARGGGSDRGRRHRRQVRGLGRRARRRGGDGRRQGDRRHEAVQGLRASPHTRDRAGALGARRRTARADRRP